MANVVGRDILVRMLHDIDGLKRSAAATADAVEELRGADRTQTGAISQLQAAVAQLQAAVAQLQAAHQGDSSTLALIHDQLRLSETLFTRLRGGVEALLDSVGSVEAAVDDHELRLLALEGKKS